MRQLVELVSGAAAARDNSNGYGGNNRFNSHATAKSTAQPAAAKPATASKPAATQPPLRLAATPNKPAGDEFIDFSDFDQQEKAA